MHRPETPEAGAWLRGDELRAWQLVLPPEASFTHLTAAEVLGWWLPPTLPRPPLFVGLPEAMSRPRRRGLVVIRQRRCLDGLEHDGIRLASPVDVLRAAARDLGLLDLVVLTDSALRLEHVNRAELLIALHERRRGAPRLRQAVRLADARSESPWESVARVLHTAADIPVEPQYVVRDESGTFVARGDLWIRGTRRLHEYDGDVHRTAAQQARDLDRDRRLQLIGWQRFGYAARRLVSQGALVIRDADLALERDWDARRLQRWNAMIRESACSAAGRQRLAERWRRASPDPEPAATS